MAGIAYGDEVFDHTTSAAVEERAKLRKSFGRFDIFFFLICTLVGLDTLGAVASNGAQGFTWLAFLAVFFFLPYAFLVAELGSAFTEEGGCYVWVKLAFGRLVACVNTVFYWFSNPVWVGGLLSITALTTFQVFFVDLSRFWEYVFSLVFIWFVVSMVILSIGIGKWIPTLGAWARIALLGFFTFSVVVYAIKNGVHAPPVHQFKPTYTLFIALVPVLFFQYVGFELPNAAGDEMKNPQRDVPFTIIRSMFAAVILYGIPIMSIILVLPSDQITGLGGFIDAMKAVFTVYGGSVAPDGTANLTGAGHVLGDLAAAGFILVLLSSATTWLMGADRSQAVAGYDGAGPRAIGRFSKRYGTPIVANIVSGVVATIVMVCAFELSNGNADKYFNAVLNVVLLFTTISYIVVFPALIKLRYSHGHVERPFRVPFGMAGVWVCGILTTFWAVFASTVGLFPGLLDHQLLNDNSLPEGFTRAGFEATVFVPVILTLAVGLLFYVLGSSTRSQIAEVPVNPAIAPAAE